MEVSPSALSLSQSLPCQFEGPIESLMVKYTKGSEKVIIPIWETSFPCNMAPSSCISVLLRSSGFFNIPPSDVTKEKSLRNL